MPSSAAALAAPLPADPRVAAESLQWVRPTCQERSQQTLERILDAAEELAIEKGFERATVAEIVRRAGSSVGAFYTRFADKDALLNYLLERFVEQAEATVAAGLEPSRWSGVELGDIFHALIDFNLRVFRERRYLLSALATLSPLPPSLSAYREVLVGHIAARLKELFAARGQRIGRPDPDNVAFVVVWTVLSALESAVFQEHQDREGPQQMSRAAFCSGLAEMALAYLDVHPISEEE